ncbi:GNAT family N-acetyltransferase [Dyella choica]|uniref:N-acetyltransferase n=1 Tax=Dyella choica TaxID=1927959 RepID=A0A432MCD8_9GAMM|nr:GNAT family N-acetyltransferase [Dyella choica]RUL79896.1 N-acetyltransferase [Dyella choica]
MSDVIESTRLFLRPFSSTDAESAYRSITPSLTRYMSWEPPASPREFADVWQQWIQAYADKTEFVFAIREKQDRGFLGLVGLHGAQEPSPELGIWIREERHGNGFGREAVASVFVWASANLGCANFIYPVAEDNHSSRRIAESLGGVIVDRRVTPKYNAVVYSIRRHTRAG